MEYDPETCATAGELRDMGFPIPDSIPDCGWVPRASVRVNPASATDVDPNDPTVVRFTTDVDFLEPFRWMHFQGLMPLEGP